MLQNKNRKSPKISVSLFKNKYMGRPKKFAPAQLKQLDGEVINLKDNLKKKAKTATTLDQILGDTGIGRYGTLNEDEYASRLRSYSFADLQREAVNNAIIPTDDRNRLINKLISIFREHRAKYTPISAQNDKTNVETYKKVAAIMSDAR